MQSLILLFSAFWISFAILLEVIFINFFYSVYLFNSKQHRQKTAKTFKNIFT